MTGIATAVELAEAQLMSKAHHAKQLGIFKGPRVDQYQSGIIGLLKSEILKIQHIVQGKTDLKVIACFLQRVKPANKGIAITPGAEVSISAKEQWALRIYGQPGFAIGNRRLPDSGLYAADRFQRPQGP